MPDLGSRWLWVASLLLALPLVGQQSDPGPGLLQKSVAAQMGSTPATDVTMTGTVTVNDGTKTESGAITLVATAAGQSEIVVTLPSGTSTQTRDYSATPRTGTNQGPGGTAVAEFAENLLGPHPAWFYPAFVASGAASTGYRTEFRGNVTKSGSGANHVAVWPAQAVLLSSGHPSFPLSPAPAAAPEYLGQQELYLDATSGLPVALEFRVHGYQQGHPDKPASGPSSFLLSEARFSDYQQVQGRPVATHLQLYVAKIPALDIHISSVSFNQGARIGH